MAKRQVTTSFDIVDPPTGTRLGASFGVYGNCPQLAENPALTVTVTLTLTNLDGDPVTRSQVAATNQNAETWEAFFDDVPESTENSGRAVAHCSEGDIDCDAVTSLTVDTEDEAGLDIEFPVQGDVVAGPLGPIPVGKDKAASPKAKGKHRRTSRVFAYATDRGKVLKLPIEVDSTPVLVGKKPWQLDLNDLFGESTDDGRFGLHYRIVAADGRTHRVSRGSFVVD